MGLGYKLYWVKVHVPQIATSADNQFPQSLETCYPLPRAAVRAQDPSYWAREGLQASGLRFRVYRAWVWGFGAYEELWLPVSLDTPPPPIPAYCIQNPNSKP